MAIFEREAARISAVILDMTMPVILSSGFGEMALDGFIQQPYTAANLAKAVRQAIRGA